jgi:hypothetical protein
MLLRAVQALKVAVDVKVLPYRQLIEEDVMLGADADDLLHLLGVLMQFLGPLHVINQILSEAAYNSTCCLHHACQHRDSRGLPCAIVAEQSKDLILIKGKR